MTAMPLADHEVNTLMTAKFHLFFVQDNWPRAEGAEFGNISSNKHRMIDYGEAALRSGFSIVPNL